MSNYLLPGYDAWLEQPYQDAYAGEALYEAFIEAEGERIFDEIQNYIADEYLNSRIENDAGIVKERAQLENLIQQVADLLANLRSYDDGLVSAWDEDQRYYPEADDYD